jgi:NAD(P)-dependent dehydrogenase (short-subunit alcohol dehydrogenase family)
MTVDLHNRVAIVTGAGKGLGRQHAGVLARCGARVVGQYRYEVEQARIAAAGKGA